MRWWTKRWIVEAVVEAPHISVARPDTSVTAAQDLLQNEDYIVRMVTAARIF